MELFHTESTKYNVFRYFYILFIKSNLNGSIDTSTTE